MKNRPPQWTIALVSLLLLGGCGGEKPATVEKEEALLIGRWKLVAGAPPAKLGMIVEYTADREVLTLDRECKPIEHSMKNYWHLARHQSGDVLLLTESSYDLDQFFPETWKSTVPLSAISVDTTSLKCRIFKRHQTGPAAPDKALFEFERMPP
jgi:hypothetical protein